MGERQMHHFFVTAEDVEIYAMYAWYPQSTRRTNIIPSPIGFEMQTHNYAFPMPTVAKPLNCILLGVSCLHMIHNIPFLAEANSVALTSGAFAAQIKWSW